MLNCSSRNLLLIIKTLPNFLWPLKWYIIKKSLKEVGTGFRFNADSVFIDHKLISIGNNVFMGQNTIINTIVPIQIGNSVMFGPQVMVMGGDHNFTEVGMLMKDVKEGGENQPIIIEDDVWVGARTIILKGVKVSEGVVIGAGSVVTKSLPPYSICVGNPCFPIRIRFSEYDLRKHLKIVGSKYSIDEINHRFMEFKDKNKKE